MILKIVDENNSTICAVQVYENSFDGTTKVQDTYHIRAVENGSDTVFGTNEEEITVTIDVGVFKQNCLIAGEVFNQFCEESDEKFYRKCMNAICEKLEVGIGPVPDRAYEIWSIIEEEYL